MKIVVTNKQLKTISEQNVVGYTPDKIDSFVKEGLEYVVNAQKLYKKYYDLLLTTSIGDVFNNIEKYKTMIDKLELGSKYLEKLASKYYDVVDTYELGNFPDNVRKLNQISHTIDNLSFEISQVKDVYQDIYDSIEHFIKWNNEKTR